MEVTHAHISFRSGSTVEVLTHDTTLVVLKARRWGATIAEFMEPHDARTLAAALLDAAARVESMKPAAPTTAAEIRAAAKHDTSCVGAFARARP